MKPEMNFPSVFSLPRAFQRYKVCDFSSPIVPFSIFGLFSVENSGKQMGLAAEEEGNETLSLWAPLSVREIRDEGGTFRVISAHRFRPHASGLMRDKRDTLGAFNNLFLLQTLSSAKIAPLLFGLSNLHPVMYCPQVAPLKTFDQIPAF
jgi:hypothetical protein